MDMPVDEPGEDEPAGSVDKSGLAIPSGRRFRANFGYLPAADYDPATWPWPAACAVDQRAVFDDEDIVRGRTHGRLQKNPFATYDSRLFAFSSN